MPSSMGSSPPKDGTWVSCTAGRFFTIWATRKALQHLMLHQIHTYFALTQSQGYSPVPSHIGHWFVIDNSCVDNQWVMSIKEKWCHWGWKTVLSWLFGWLPAREEALHRLLSKQAGWCVPVEETTCRHLPREEVGWLRSCAESIWRPGNKGPSIYRSFSATTPRPK